MTVVGPNESWRLVYRDGEDFAILFYSGSYTESTAYIEEFTTQAAAEARSAELGRTVVLNTP